MPEVTLTAEAGREIGSRPTRRLRSQGKIPAVVYGHGSDPIPVAVVAREFQIAMSGEAGLNSLLSLKVDKQNFLTLARNIQHHPFRNVVTHVDFQIVRRDEVISAEIPINLIGEPVEVQHGDGVVDQQLFTLAIKAKPADIPPSVDIDISDLTIGASLHVSDITIPERRRARVRPGGHRGGRTTSPGPGHRRRRGGSGGHHPRSWRGGTTVRGLRRGRVGRGGSPPAPPPAWTGISAAGEPRSTSWWSGWATPGASSPAPATTPGPRWWPRWPNAIRDGSKPNGGCVHRCARCVLASTRPCWQFPRRS